MALSVRNTKIPGTRKSEAELELVRTLLKPCDPVGVQGHTSRGHGLKNNYWREEDVRRAAEAAGAHPVRLFQRHSSRAATCPQLPAHGQRDPGRTQGSFYPIAVAQKKLNTFELPLAT